jgi:hypothetical protein
MKLALMCQLLLNVKLALPRFQCVGLEKRHSTHMQGQDVECNTKIIVTYSSGSDGF